MGRPRAGPAAAVAVVFAGCQFVWPAHYQIKEGQRLETAGRYAEAVAAYEVVLMKWPTKPEALVALSRAAALYDERLNQWQKAASYLQDLKTRSEGQPEYASVLLRLGRVLEHAGSPFKDSLEVYGTLCKKCAAAPESVSSLLAQGRLHEAMHNWPAAKSAYEEAVAKLGNTPEAATVKVRLQAVWLLEAVGTYYAGRVEDGAALAEAALAKGVTVEEVRNGLDALLKRYRTAQRFWKAGAASVSTDDVIVTDAVDPAIFIYRAERSTAAGPMPGREVTYDGKRKRFMVAEVPVADGGVVATTSTSSGKPKGSDQGSAKPWTYKSPEDMNVTGLWWSPDARYLGWIGRSKESSRRAMNVVDIKKHRSWTAVSDPSGAQLGQVMAFMPGAGKLLFTRGDLIVISDLRGGNQVNFPLRPDRARQARFATKEVEWLAVTGDGLEIAAGVNQPPSKDKKGAPEAKREAVWKVSFGVQEF